MEFVVVTRDTDEKGSPKGHSSFIISAKGAEEAITKACGKYRAYTQEAIFVVEWTPVMQENWSLKRKAAEHWNNANRWFGDDGEVTPLPRREDHALDVWIEMNKNEVTRKVELPYE